MNQTLKFLFILLISLSQLSVGQAQTSTDAITAFGDSLLKQEKYDEAFSFFSSNVGHIPTDLQGAFMLDFGLSLYRNKRYEEAIPYFEFAKQKGELLRDDQLLSRALVNIGASYTSLGALKKGMEEYKLAIPVLSKLEDDTSLGVVYFNLAHGYKESAEYDKAIKSMKPAIESFERINDQYRLARTYETLGNIYREVGKDSLSLEYQQKSLSLNREINDLAGISSSLNDLGNTYKSLYDYDKALYFYTQSLEVGDSIHKSTTLGNMAEVYGLQGNYKKAEKYFQKALLLREQEQDLKAIANILTDLGQLYLNQNRIPKAHEMLNKALEVANDETFNDITLRNLEIQQKLFIKLGDFKSAYDVQSRVVDVKEAIFTANGQRIIEQLTIDFRLKDLEKENTILTEEAKLQRALAEKEKASRRVLLLILLLAGLVIIFIGYVYSQSRKNTRWQIAKRREIQHRTKNFLQTLINLFHFQVQNVNQPDARAVMKVAQNRLDAMMMIHRALSSNLKEINFSEYAKELVNMIRKSYLDEVSDVKIEWDTDEIFLDADQATPAAIILNELVSNAFKHALSKHPSPLLIVSLHVAQAKLKIVVKDNGGGIQPVSPVSDSSEGLKLIKIFVRQLNGRLEFFNENGTTVTIELKITQ